MAECLEESAPGRYTVRGQTGSIPLLFSVRAVPDDARRAHRAQTIGSRPEGSDQNGER